MGEEIYSPEGNVPEQAPIPASPNVIPQDPNNPIPSPTQPPKKHKILWIILKVKGKYSIKHFLAFDKCGY